ACKSVTTARRARRETGLAWRSGVTLMKPQTILFVALGVASSAAVLRALEVPSGAPVFSDPTSITNPYQAFVPGRMKHYERIQGNLDAEDFEFCTDATRTFAWNGTSVACRVLQEMSL